MIANTGIAVAVLAGGCVSNIQATSDWKLEGGRTLGKLAGDADPAVVLLMDPTHCFSCTNLLALWAEMLSIFYGARRMSDGSTALVYHDLSVAGEPPMVDFLATVDLRSVHTVSRDTLYLLDRTINETEDGMKTCIRRYEIDTSRCDWLPVESRGPTSH